MMANRFAKVNEIYHGVGQGYTFDGLGILLSDDGQRFFVKGLIKGEEADVKVTYASRNANYADIIKLYSLSPHRIQPKCPVATACGGCQFQHIDYEEQLKIKQEKVINAFRTIAKSNFPVDECVGSKAPYYYRNKTQIPLGMDKKGNIISGFYRAKTHDIIPTPECAIENQRSNGIMATVRDLMKSMKIDPYDEDKRTGVIRHILIRASYHTPEIMVVIVANVPSFPSRNNFVNALRKAHPEITTIVQNTNTRATNVILGEHDKVLFGPGFILDDILGVRFRISPQSFFQVNPLQTETLYSIAINKAALTGNERVLDAYCGIGTLSLIAASKARSVVGVEINNKAIKDAKENAFRNNISNVSFYTADAGEFMEIAAHNNEQYDVVLMDPPRKGADEKFLNSLMKLSPQKIVYVSCDPGTLARDVAILNKKYEIKSITPVDMFSQTHHVETVVLMSKIK